MKSLFLFILFLPFFSTAAKTNGDNPCPMKTHAIATCTLSKTQSKDSATLFAVDRISVCASTKTKIGPDPSSVKVVLTEYFEGETTGEVLTGKASQENGVLNAEFATTNDIVKYKLTDDGLGSKLTMKVNGDVSKADYICK